MKGIFKIILSFILLISTKIYAEELVYTFSEWSSEYPSNYPEIFIQSEDRYLWYIINEQGDYEETEEYYAILEGYERIDSSKKTFYRVINNDYVVFDRNWELVTDLSKCVKVFCTQIFIKKYEIPQEEEPPKPKEEEEIIINPETYDGIYNYLICFGGSLLFTLVKLNNKLKII